MIRVIVADDHNLVRQGIRALLDKADDIEVVGEAGDGQAAIELVERLSPDVLVTDISMPRLNGTQTIERLHSMQSPTRVIILSMYSDETVVRQALRSGAKGYLLKNSLTEELLLAVRAAYRNETYLSPSISSAIVNDLLASQVGTQESDPFDRLSTRELEVLQLIAEGNTNSDISQLLNVSIKTVEKHRSNLMSKLAVHDLASLIRVAIKHGLIFIDQ
ncbi:MAG TPA: response regulator transcription factor [Anaerolineales bacterium]|nr:response regulator transcription factor [Anaerolineales bacterium]